MAEPTEEQRRRWAKEAAAKLRDVGYSEEQIAEYARWKVELVYADDDEEMQAPCEAEQKP